MKKAVFLFKIKKIFKGHLVISYPRCYDYSDSDFHAPHFHRYSVIDFKTIDSAKPHPSATAKTRRAFSEEMLSYSSFAIESAQDYSHTNPHHFLVYQLNAASSFPRQNYFFSLKISYLFC